MGPEDRMRGLAYARNLITCRESESFATGLFACGVGLTNICYSTFFDAPFFETYLVVGMFVLQKFVKIKFKETIIGTTPYEYKIPDSGVAFADAILDIAFYFDLARLVVIWIGILLFVISSASPLKLIGMSLIMFAIFLMGLVRIWYFVKVWMWENVVLALAYLFLPLCFVIGNGYFLSLSIMSFTVGGLCLLGTGGLYLRWRTWHRKIVQDLANPG